MLALEMGTGKHDTFKQNTHRKYLLKRLWIANKTEATDKVLSQGLTH